VGKLRIIICEWDEIVLHTYSFNRRWSSDIGVDLSSKCGGSFTLTNIRYGLVAALCINARFTEDRLVRWSIEGDACDKTLQDKTLGYCWWDIPHSIVEFHQGKVSSCHISWVTWPLLDWLMNDVIDVGKSRTSLYNLTRPYKVIIIMPAYKSFFRQELIW
jgi:hypothetical protein